MNAFIIIKRTTGNSDAEKELISFTFRKNAYLAYSLLEAKFITKHAPYEDAAEVYLSIDNKIVHHGLADSLKTEYSGDTVIMTLTSKSFTSELTRNQLSPGMRNDLTFNDLMDEFYTFPNVTHENSSSYRGYIYMNGKNSLWDSIVNFTYKANGHHPFIRGTNCIRISPASDPKVFVYNRDQLSEINTKVNNKKIISHFHMADMGGEYGQYEHINTEAAELGIVRHSFFDLDMEYLYDPESALLFRESISSKERIRKYCRYSGYNGEDLSDLISFPGVNRKRICAVEINGSPKGVFTEISVFEDKFPH